MWSKEKLREYQRQWRQRPESKLKLMASQRRYRKAHPEKQIESNKRNLLKLRLKSLGLSMDDYSRMLTDQGHRCAICGTHADELDRRLAIDHCHKTGRVRGLLCNLCNTALGMFKDLPLPVFMKLSYYVQNGGFLTTEQQWEKLETKAKELHGWRKPE